MSRERGGLPPEVLGSGEQQPKPDKPSRRKFVNDLLLGLGAAGIAGKYGGEAMGRRAAEKRKASEPVPYNPEGRPEDARIFAVPGVKPEDLRKVHELYKLFDQYARLPVVFIKENSLQAGMPMSQNEIDPPTKETLLRGEIPKQIILDSRFFTDPRFENYGKLAACHDMAHSLTVWTPQSQESIDTSQDIKRSFNRLREQILRPKDVKLDDDESEEIDKKSVFRVIDESTYIQPKGSPKVPGWLLGHPYENYQEMFASGLDVMRNFPKEFTLEYSSLPVKEQSLIGQAACGIIRHLETLRYDLDVRGLIPEADEIKKMIRYQK